MPDVVNGPTTEDLVDEYPEGQEAELLPALDSERGESFPIQPYEGATPVSLDMLADSGEQMS